MDDGDKDGQNELVRIRTRTGHQILLHNSQDLIYIANSKGSAWIELTSNGKIDIYAQDSISVHTEQDFNFKADRDIHLDAGRDLKIAVGRNYQADVNNNYTLLVTNSGYLTFAGTLDHSVESDATFSYGKNLHVGASESIFNTATKNFHIVAGSDLFETAVGTMNLKSGGNMLQSSGAIFNVGSVGLYIATAKDIHLNGPAAASAKSATAADSADIPSALPRFKLPNRQKNAGWDNGRFYRTDDLTSIMKRVPTHEPWDQHENINRSQFEPTLTDTDVSAPTYNQKVRPPITPQPNTRAAPASNAPSSPLVDGRFRSQRNDNSKAATAQSNPGVPAGPAVSAAPPVTQLNRANMPSDWTKDLAFFEKVKACAKEINCSHIDLLACMAWETGRTFSPAVRNKKSQATGLIQFLETTIASLSGGKVKPATKTSPAVILQFGSVRTSDLEKMTRVEQMDWVLKYFKAGPIGRRNLTNVTLEDLYMSILYPVAVGKPNDFVLFRQYDDEGRELTAYKQNSGTDVNRDGQATKAEAALKVREQLGYIRTQLLKIPESGGVWTDSSGNPIVDGSGNPVRYGSSAP
jgi:uncharacterized protein (DUF2345 family)